ATLAANTSPSPAKAPAVTLTVALASVRLSGSLTEAAGAMVSVWPITKCRSAATFDSVGASLTAGIATGGNAGAVRLLEAERSLAVQVSTRLKFEPKLVGLSLGVTKVTESSTLW